LKLFEVDAFEHSTDTKVQKQSQAPDFPNSIEQAQEIVGQLDRPESLELKEIILILELLCAKIAHFERPDFLHRFDELSLTPVLIPKDMAEELRDMKGLLSGEEGLLSGSVVKGCPGKISLCSRAQHLSGAKNSTISLQPRRGLPRMRCGSDC
jgi:hypothetical protein